MPDDAKKLAVSIEATSNLPQTADKDAEALKKVKKETEDTAEKMELLKKPTGEVRRITSELDRALPGLGEGFRILRGGAMGAVGGVIAGFVELKRYIDETSKALDEMAKNNANADFLPNIEERANVLAAAAESAQAYADKLNEIATGEQSVADKLKDQLALDKALEVARATLMSAQKGLELAQLQAAEAANKISPEKAAEKRAEIEKRYIAEAQAARESAQDKELADKQKQLEEDISNQDALAQKQKDLNESLVKEEEHRKLVQLDPADQLKKIHDAMSELDKAQAAMDKFRRKAITDPTAPGYDPHAFEPYQQDIDTAQGKVNNFEKQLRQFMDATSPAQGAKEKGEHDALTEAQRLETENKDQIRSLTNEIRLLREIIAQSRPLDQQAAGARSQTVSAQEQARMAKQFEEDARFLNHFDHSHTLTPEVIDQAKDRVNDMKDLMNQAANALRTLSDWKDAQDNLARAVEIIQSQARYHAQNTMSQ